MYIYSLPSTISGILFIPRLGTIKGPKIQVRRIPKFGCFSSGGQEWCWRYGRMVNLRMARGISTVQPELNIFPSNPTGPPHLIKPRYRYHTASNALDHQHHNLLLPQKKRQRERKREPAVPNSGELITRSANPMLNVMMNHSPRSAASSQFSPRFFNTHHSFELTFPVDLWMIHAAT